MAQTRNDIIKRFCEVYSHKYGLPDCSSQVRDLLMINVIDFRALRNYLIVHDFHNTLIKNDGKVIDSLYEVSENYSLSVAMIKFITRKARNKKRAVTPKGIATDN